MRRVLIPSDNRDFTSCLASVYRRRGWEVVVGVANFDLHGARFDLVHLQWPEELSGWEPPDAARREAIIQGIDRWAEEGARLLLTVHNLYPHRHSHDPRYRALFDACYERLPVLAHFTDASRKLILDAFPVAAQRTNIVTGFFNFDELLPPARDSVAARRHWRLAPEEFVVLSFGMLREWAEVELIRGGFDAARVPQKRLLMAGRYQEFGPVWRQRWRRWSWSRWLARRRAVFVTQSIPDESVHQVVDAADVLIVPRLHSLSSGLIALAASFGKPFIAPDSTPFAELAAGTQNPIYRAGNVESLGAAIERAATLDSDAMAIANRALADAWSWDKIVAAGVEAVGLG